MLGRAVDEWKGLFVVDCPVTVTNFTTVRQYWMYKGKGSVDYALTPGTIKNLFSGSPLQ